MVNSPGQNRYGNALFLKRKRSLSPIPCIYGHIGVGDKDESERAVFSDFFFGFEPRPGRKDPCGALGIVGL